MKAKKPAPKKPKAAKAPKEQPKERREKIPCPACQGEGFYGATPCERCKGDGEILARLTRPPGATLPQGGGRGRTPKYTAENVTEIAEALSRGMTYKQAAGLIPVSEETLRNWIESDNEFLGAIKKAVSERLLARIRYVEGANENWQSIAWLLERCHGTQFAPPKTTIHNEHSFKKGVDEGDMKELEEMLNLL